MIHKPISGLVPWPADEVKRFRESGVWKERNLVDTIDQVALSHPHKIAVADVKHGVFLSYAELVESSKVAALRLHEMGFRDQDHVVFALPNTWHFVVSLLACARIGIIPAMALAEHRKHELTHICSHTQAKALFAPAEWREFDFESLALDVAYNVASIEKIFCFGDNSPQTHNLDALLTPPEEHENCSKLAELATPNPYQPVVFQLSGGTTGTPKLISRTHNDYVYNIEKSAEVSHLNENSVLLSCLPIAHNFGLASPGVLGALYSAGTVVLSASPNPVKCFPIIEEHGVTIAAMVPAVAQRWIDYQNEKRTDQIKSLEVIQVGGARMPDEKAPEIQRVLGARLQQVYGMAEGLINMTRLDDPEEIILTTQGRPISPLDEIRVINAAGEEVDDGERGLLITRGPYTPRGYFDDPEANERSFIDGWYCPGDVVEKLPDGNLRVHGRDKDIINRGGEKISAEEVESVLYQLTSIEQVAVVGMPDEFYGSRVCAYVKPKAGQRVTLEEITAHLSEIGIARFKYPERLEIAESLPMTKIKKIDKVKLRKDVEEKLKCGE
ncbi:AMP-binding protein [Corynebacterium breve]|uniref:AMP-binding protein n=1 Tax=Corynebacterium breve TaxID=3049799 RepID=A0ABY8VDS0_9CORY|nr:AMP-binding protein [Corynebacterium breve]WIM67809.1 AMP-binding protein [Corynebacterium breve]